ncbi:penicillin-binding protein 2 [Porphyromonas sp.]|uniref:peptidoglycan D,D-transpeptidase FtsI family protein n=1 Tax=Porphyromonas sp. TaxID=1924944 RepID=UPI0026DB3C37|nr:penicillin-binding transpeptidase domain-containing protein [Porphyromonas sp.]MDO4771028.1 penicillin-binding transpeptidase domain-containing protein [Porphyromonas sp.]
MQRKNSKYAIRKYFISSVFVLVVLIYVLRLFYLQVLNPDFKMQANSIAFLRKAIYPSRGMIYDNNDKLLVYNKSTANVMVITREIKDFDTLDLCSILKIDREYIIEKMKSIKDKRTNKGYSPYLPQLFMSQITSEEAGLLQEKLYKFPGFYIEHRTTRDYNYPSAALVLGTTGEVNQKDIEDDQYYTPGDYSGRTGIERSYEKILRGEKGVSVLLRDAHGRIQGSYEDGKYDKEVVSGHDLKLGLDIELQTYGEKLMQGKRGAIVMIEPQTGEIRCMVSAPSFSPTLLIGRERGANHKLLEQDPQKPLYNRAIMGTYPPGSTFKLAQGAIFLKEKVITPQTLYSCHHGYPLLGNRPACHPHGAPLSLVPAIATSCNAYFCWGLRALLEDNKRFHTIQDAFENWKNNMVNLGFGYKLNVDLPGERRGYIPNAKVYDKVHAGKWNSSSIISIAIGQGEILTTPLQIANLGAIIANKGYYYTPHMVKEITAYPKDSLKIKRMDTHIPPEVFEVIEDGMAAAVFGGTCRGAAIPNIAVCGKTGTIENAHGKDHSAFVGYAPRENPRIAICVYVENAGFGATFAVPIARLMMEYYLKGSLSEGSLEVERRMINAQVL